MGAAGNGAAGNLDAGGSAAAGSGAAGSGAAGSGASGSGAAGTGGSSSGGNSLAAHEATVKVETPVSPLMAKTYQLPKTGTFGTQRNADEFFANFDGPQDFGSMYGGDNISLRFSGFFSTGTFACGDRAKPNDSYAIQTTVDLWTFVNSKSELKQYKGLNAGSTCSVTVTAMDATTIEGTYTAKLYSDATTFVKISGAFHAAP